MRICVVGLGYIGFPTACLLAKAGHEVVGVDTSYAVIEQLRNRRVHITEEPGLGEIAQFVLDSGALTVSQVPVEADAHIICVPTPLRAVPSMNLRNGPIAGLGSDAVGTEVAATREHGRDAGTLKHDVTRPLVDLSYVEAAVHSIVPVLRADNLVILESTVPPGTTEQVVLPILESNGWTRDKILLVHAPERVIPGAILREMVENDRIVGGLTPEAAEAARELYASFVQGRILTTDATTAEFVKLIENTYRDVNIALANELARIADYLGIDVQESISLANRHPRVNILSPGPGVGGHCIPVDPNFLIERAPNLTRLIQVARSENDAMRDYVVSIVDELSKKEKLRRWTLLGAAYKANVSDERNSPSLYIADRLTSLGYSVVIHDPFIERFNRPLEEVVTEADGLLLLTDHSVYRNLDPQEIANVVSKRFIVDTRLSLDPRAWASQGFVVRRVGDGRGAALVVS